MPPDTADFKPVFQRVTRNSALARGACRNLILTVPVCHVKRAQKLTTGTLTNEGDYMPKSISLLTLAAAVGLAGAAMAQDTATEPATAADAEAATDTSGAATDEATTDAPATAETAAPAPDTSAAETGSDDAATDDAATDSATGTATDAPATESAADPATGKDNAFSTGQQVDGEKPAVYIREEFGDWSLRCFRNDDGDDPCQLYQLLREEGGNPVAEFSVFRIEGQAPAVAGATAIVPLVTLLTEELKMSVDGATAKSYPYRVCTEAGCVAQMGLTAEDVNTFKRGKAAQITLVPAQAPDKKVRIDISLSGFTAGYEAVGSFTE